jgi:hypothetical protein
MKKLYKNEFILIKHDIYRIHILLIDTYIEWIE